MFKIIPILLAVSFLYGCAAANFAGDQIAWGVNRYCDRVTQLERDVVRARVNLKTHPNEIQVICDEDVKSQGTN